MFASGFVPSTRKRNIPNVFQTPKNFDNWSDKRKSEWTANRDKWFRQYQRHNNLLEAGKVGIAENVRGSMQKLRLKEQQQRSAYNLGVSLTQAEKNQMDFQQRFIEQLGEISSYQTQQTQATQGYLATLLEQQNTALRSQETYQQRVLELQRQAIEEQKDRERREELLAKNQQARLDEQQQRAGLFQLTKDNETVARRQALQRFMRYSWR